MNNLFTLCMTLLCLQSIAHINAPSLKKLIDDRRARGGKPYTSAEMKQFLAARMAEKARSPLDQIARSVGKTVEFLVNGDYVKDETLLTKARSDFDKMVNDVEMPKYITERTRAELVGEGYSAQDVSEVVQNIRNDAWTKYGAIRTIYEYQTRKGKKTLISYWRVPADTSDIYIADKFYDEYMAGAQAFVELVANKPIDQVIQQLAESVTVVVTQDDLKLNKPTWLLQQKQDSFYESAKAYLAQATDPDHLLGASRIALGDDKPHLTYINELLESAWTAFAAAHDA